MKPDYWLIGLYFKAVILNMRADRGLSMIMAHKEALAKWILKIDFLDMVADRGLSEWPTKKRWLGGALQLRMTLQRTVG